MSHFSTFGKTPTGSSALDSRVRSLELWRAGLSVAFMLMGGFFGYEHYWAIPKLVDASYAGAANKRIAEILAQAEVTSGQISTTKEGVIALATAARESMPLRYKTVRVQLCTGNPGGPFANYLHVHSHAKPEDFDRYAVLTIPNVKIIGAWWSASHHVMIQGKYTHIIPEVVDGNKVVLVMNAGDDKDSLMEIDVHVTYYQDPKPEPVAPLKTASLAQ